VWLRSHRKGDVVDQPLGVALRCGDLQGGRLTRVIERGGENAVGVEKAIVETDVVFNLDRLLRNPELGETLDHIVPLGRRHFQLCLRIEVVEHGFVVFHNEPVNDLVTIPDAFLLRRGPGGIHVPPNAENNQQKNKENGKDAFACKF
jgi:hypothetical protein